MNKYVYRNGGSALTVNTRSGYRIQVYGTDLHNGQTDMYGGATNLLYLQLNPTSIAKPSTAFKIVATEPFVCFGLPESGNGDGHKLLPLYDTYDSQTGRYTRVYNPGDLQFPTFNGHPSVIYITKTTYTTDGQNRKYMDNFDASKIVSCETYQGWLPANLNEKLYSNNTKINPKNNRWDGIYLPQSYIYPISGYEQYYTARYWRVDNSTQSRTYTIITKGNNVQAINNGYWGVRGTFQDGLYAGITYIPTLTSTYDSVSDTTTTTFTDSPDACYFWFGNLSTAVQPDQLDTIDPQLYAPFEGWNFGMLHSYGNITETTTTEITNRTNKAGAVNVSNKTLVYNSSNYQSYWPITPGDTIAFKYTNTSTKTVGLYTSSSQSVYTGQFYWFILSSTANGTALTPFPVDFHTETIEGEQYYVFEVPAGMNYLMVSYTPGSGAYYPSTYITAKVLKKETTTTKGWTDITNGNQGGSYP